MRDALKDQTDTELSGEERRLAALGRAKEAHRQETRIRIEDAAIDLFGRHGIDVVTVDQIADAAGISRRSFYRYFGSPDDIVIVILSQLMEGWADAVRSRPIEESFMEATRQAAAFFDTLLEPDSKPRRLFHTLGSSPDAWIRMSGKLQTRVADSLRDVIAERLRHAGKDPGLSGGVAASLAVVIMWTVGRAVQERRPLRVGEIETVMEALGAMVVAVPERPE